MSLGQRVLLITEDSYSGSTGVVTGAIANQYEIQLDKKGEWPVYVWARETIPIPKKISKAKLKMLTHLYS